MIEADLLQEQLTLVYTRERKLNQMLQIAEKALEEKKKFEPGPRGYENLAATLALAEIQKLKLK